MRKLILPLLICPIILVSCEEKQKPLTKSEIKFKADSIAASKMGEMRADAAEDLDKRKAIEVKAKADSIVAAYLDTHKSPQDTIHSSQSTIQPPQSTFQPSQNTTQHPQSTIQQSPDTNKVAHKGFRGLFIKK